MRIVTFKLNDETLKALDEAAKHAEMSRSAYIKRKLNLATPSPRPITSGVGSLKKDSFIAGKQT